MGKRLLSILGTLLLLFGFTSHYASAATPNVQKDVVNSAKLPLIAIKALDSNNNPLKNALVEVIPSGEKSATYSTRTNARGQSLIFYKLSQIDLDKAEKNSGILNFSVVISKNGSEPEVYNFSRDIHAVTSFAALKSLSTNSVPKYGPPSIQIGSKSSYTKWANGLKLLKQSANNTSMQSTAISPNDYVCQYYRTDHQESTDWAIVGEAHNAINSDVTFKYGKAADTTFSTKISYDGGTTWSTNGSASVSNSYSSAHTKTSVGHHTDMYWDDNGYQVLGQFEFYKDTYSNGVCGGHYTTLSPYIWTGGLDWGNSVGYYDGSITSYYTHMDTNDTFYTASATAKKYSSGVSLWGTSLSAQSDYSTNVQISWNFSRGPGYLYGLNNYPTMADVIYAQ